MRPNSEIALETTLRASVIHLSDRIYLFRRRRAARERELVALKTKHSCIGDVRGLGLFWAVELVQDRATKKPLNTMQDKITGKPLTVDKVAAEMLKNGVAVQAWISHFVIAPPLIIDKSDIDFGVSVLDAALGRVGAA